MELGDGQESFCWGGEGWEGYFVVEVGGGGRGWVQGYALLEEDVLEQRYLALGDCSEGAVGRVGAGDFVGRGIAAGEVGRAEDEGAEREEGGEGADEETGGGGGREGVRVPTAFMCEPHTSHTYVNKGTIQV